MPKITTIPHRKRKQSYKEALLSAMFSGIPEPDEFPEYDVKPKNMGLIDFGAFAEWMSQNVDRLNRCINESLPKAHPSKIFRLPSGRFKMIILIDLLLKVKTAKAIFHKLCEMLKWKRLHVLKITFSTLNPGRLVMILQPYNNHA